MELNVRQATLSRILDMLYTQASAITVLWVKILIADIQLFFKGFDAGLLPSYIYKSTRSPAKFSAEEQNAQRLGCFLLPELTTEEIQKRYDCIQSKEDDLFIFKIKDTFEGTELILKADNIVTVDNQQVHGRSRLRAKWV